MANWFFASNTAPSGGCKRNLFGFGLSHIVYASCCSFLFPCLASPAVLLPPLGSLPQKGHRDGHMAEGFYTATVDKNGLDELD